MTFCHFPQIFYNKYSGSRKLQGSEGYKFEFPNCLVRNNHNCVRHTFLFLSDNCQSVLEQSINIPNCSTGAANWSKVDTRQQWFSWAAPRCECLQLCAYYAQRCLNKGHTSSLFIQIGEPNLCSNSWIPFWIKVTHIWHKSKCNDANHTNDHTSHLIVHLLLPYVINIYPLHCPEKTPISPIISNYFFMANITKWQIFQPLCKQNSSVACDGLQHCFPDTPLHESIRWCHSQICNR